MPSPIALFVYNRPDHLRRTIKALAENTLAMESAIFIFSDGAKPGQEEKVSEVRAFLKTISGFQSVTIYESPANMGLGVSIINGINRVLTLHDTIIVLEDDLVSSPYFLSFLNDGLEHYAGQKEVMSVVGYNYPIQVDGDTFFLNNADCLGWATWKDRWTHFEADAGKLLSAIESNDLKYRFDMDGSYPYLKLLKKTAKGENSSWAVRWYASVFLKNGLSLYPTESLIQHIGNDEGTNVNATNFLMTEIRMQPVPVKTIPLNENVQARKNLARYFKKNVSYWGFLKNKVSFLVSKGTGKSARND